MITPHIFIGVGGSGGKTLRAIKRELKEVLASKDWPADRGFPVIWQFIHIDTPSVQDGQAFPAPLLSPGEYLGLVQPGVSLDAIITNVQSKPWDRLELEEIIAPLPGIGEYPGHVDKGAGQYRAIGRTVALARLDQIKKQVEIALAAINGQDSRSQMAELSRLFNTPMQGSTIEPAVYVVSSLAGGSGSGQFLDVSEAIKASAPSSGWVHKQTAVLFAPDVFNDPKISVAGGIAPNSLATLNEVIAGRWRRKRTEISDKLYERFGFSALTSPSYNLGPASIYLVGKKNGDVTFDIQDDVYNATAVSISKLVLDSTIREQIDNYIIQNQQSESDPLRIKVSNHLFSPFNALGFARLSLGNRAFERYSAQRLARAAVDQIVQGHTEGMGKANEEQWVVKIASDEWERFWGLLALDSKSIVDAIQPEAKRQSFRVGLTSELSSESGKALNQKGLKPIGNWIQDILRSTKKLSVEKQMVWRGYREIDEWSNATQSRLMAVTNESIARVGLKPTILLLKQLRDQILANSQQNDVQPSVVDTSLPGDLSQLIKDSGASAEAQVGSDSEVVRRMVDLAGRGATSTLMQETKELGHKLEDDLARNMISPFISELEAKYTLLSRQMRDTSYHSEGKSLYDTWPTADNVPSTFKPAPNERYLISWESFGKLFDQLLVESVNGEPGKVRAAVDTSIRILIQGAYSGKTADGNEEWNTGDANTLRWSPRDGSSSTPRQWSGSFAGELDTWEDIAQRFVLRKGTSMSRYLQLTLSQWLQASDEDAAERHNRAMKIADEFAQVLKFSLPYVQMNNDVLSIVHDQSELNVLKTGVTISTIPVALSSGDGDSAGSRLFNELKTLEQEKGVHFSGTLEDRFQPESSVKEIDIFSTFSKSLHHVVFDNLMQPISEAWKVAAADKRAREAFMLRRRGRNVPETIPLAPEVLDQFIRGWYVGKALGRVQAVPQGDRGTLVSVWNQDPMDSGWKSMPFPAYYPADITAVDTIPILAQSVSLALAKVNETKSLEPMKPYYSIFDLGGEAIQDIKTMVVPGPINAALKDWLLSGTLPFDVPTPNHERAGTATMTFEGRRDKLLAFLDKEEAIFEENAVDLAPGYRHTALAWELRREITKAFADIRLQISTVKTQGTID